MCLQLLDDQIVKTQAMRSSPYIGPFEERVKALEAKLNRTQVRQQQAMVGNYDTLTGVGATVAGFYFVCLTAATIASSMCCCRTSWMSG